MTTWVECMLRIGIPDFRKHAIDLILAPYLLHKRKCSFEQAASIMLHWLVNKCDPVHSLNFNPEDRVNRALNLSLTKPEIHHMKFDTLADRCPEVYELIRNELLNKRYSQ